jgi:hypothetical protein
MSVVEVTITTQPAVRADSGVALTTQPVVTVTDHEGNALEGVLVTARITTGDDKLSGTMTTTTDANGKATFSDLVIRCRTATNRPSRAGPNDGGDDRHRCNVLPRSRAEVRWAHAHPENSYAREVVEKMHGRSMKSLPERKGKSALQRARERMRQR